MIDEDWRENPNLKGRGLHRINQLSIVRDQLLEIKGPILSNLPQMKNGTLFQRCAIFCIPLYARPLCSSHFLYTGGETILHSFEMFHIMVIN